MAKFEVAELHEPGFAGALGKTFATARPYMKFLTQAVGLKW